MIAKILSRKVVKIINFLIKKQENQKLIRKYFNKVIANAMQNQLAFLQKLRMIK
jgi:hypothetical protein